MTVSSSLLALSALAALSLSACAAGGPRPCNPAADEADILVMGDSILAFHATSCSSMADVLGEELGRSVHNASQSGAKVSLDPGERYQWGEIASQYIDQEWDWVVIEGGINDLLNECDCDDSCGPVLDRLVSPDGAVGEVPALVEQALEGGARVVLVGYYQVPAEARWGFPRCESWLPELRARYQALAEQHEGVLWVDPGEVVSYADDPDLFARDRIHPSPDGSALLGQQVAAAISAAEGR